MIAASRSAQAAAPTVSCDSLTYNWNSSQNQYVFAAAASGSGVSNITGYSFNFGDNQSYNFDFPSGSTANRATGSAGHVYAKAGNYNATVKVLATINGQKQRITSPKCAVTVTIAQPASQLPNTGTQNIIEVFAVSSLIGTAVYQFAVRRSTS